MFVFTRMVRVIGPAISAALAMEMFPVSSSIWKIFPSFPEDSRKYREQHTKQEQHSFL